jgi:cobalt/nickel transport protein
MKTTAKLWIGILLLVILSPLGLILPAYLKAGGAWGEWGVEEIKNVVGYIPKGLARLAELWKAPLPDYAFKNSEGKGLFALGFSYVVSALIGIAIIVIIVWLIGKKLAKRD